MANLATFYLIGNGMPIAVLLAFKLKLYAKVTKEENIVYWRVSISIRYFMEKYRFRDKSQKLISDFSRVNGGQTCYSA